MNDERQLTDADASMIAEKLERRLLSRFYTNLGMGFWAIIWRGIIVLLLAIAAYGAFHK